MRGWRFNITVDISTATREEARELIRKAADSIDWDEVTEGYFETLKVSRGRLAPEGKPLSTERCAFHRHRPAVARHRGNPICDECNRS